MGFYFTTGQAAGELNVSSQTIRNLCARWQIKAERSAGGHYRIAPAELERLKSLESLPAAARAAIPENGVRQVKKPAHELLAPPSAEVIQSAEAAYVSERDLATDEAQLRRLRLHKEATELTDYFAERRQRISDRETESHRLEVERLEKQDREIQAQFDAERRDEFSLKWIGYALTTGKPPDAPPDYAVLVHDDLRATLDRLPLGTSDFLVEALVKDSIEHSLRPSRAVEERTRAENAAVKRALSNLPLRMQWDDALAARAQKAANGAVHAAPDVSASDLAVVASDAVQPLISEYNHRERIQAEIESIWLAGTNFDDQAAARKTVQRALAGLPVGAEDDDLKAAKETALAPIRERIRTRQQQAAKQSLIEVGMREIYWYACEMLRNPKFEYDRNETAWEIEARCKAEVEKALRTQLTGNETGDAAKGLVHQTMEEAECGR